MSPAGEKLGSRIVDHGGTKTRSRASETGGSLPSGSKTHDGEVTLTGIAKNESEKSLVTKLVTDIRGVTSVKNQMTVEEVKTK